MSVATIKHTQGTEVARAVAQNRQPCQYQSIAVAECSSTTTWSVQPWLRHQHLAAGILVEAAAHGLVKPKLQRPIRLHRQSMRKIGKMLRSTSALISA